MYKVTPIIHVLSKLGLLFLMLLLVSTLMSYFFLDSAFPASVYTALVATIGSHTAWMLTLWLNRELRPRDGFTLVLTPQLAFATVTAIPIYFYMLNMSFIDAFFEAMPGLTTAGPTIINGLDTPAPPVNFWRHTFNWLGGIGTIVLTMTILPMLGVGGTQLFKAETPGMDKESKMTPRILQVAKKLWFPYTLTMATAFVSLYLTGMSWFGTLCYTMSAVASGGFSTHDSNITYFNSVLIEQVLIFFTMFGAINFVSHFVTFANRSLKVHWHDEERRVLSSVLSGGIVVSTVYLWHTEYYLSLAGSIRFTALDFVSVGLANGFSNADFARRPLMVSLWMFSLSDALASSGSMGGKTKNVHRLVMLKFSVREMMILLHPRAVRIVEVNGRLIQGRMTLAMMPSIFTYFTTVVISSLLMMTAGLDFLSVFTAVIACITNLRPGLRAVEPERNYAVLSDVQKQLCATMMLLGQPETFTVLILFTPMYWRK